MITRVLLPVLIFAAAISADTLRLRDGSSVNGDFMGATSSDIRFSVNGEVQHFARANVAQIILGPEQGDASAPSLQPPPPPPSAPVSSEPDWVVRGPDYAGAPFLRGAKGFLPLEREVAMASRGGGMYGMGGTVYRVQGSRSNVRVRQSDRIVFVVRFESGGDPRQFQLFRLESRMGYRQVPVTNGGGMGLPLTVTQVSDRVYELTPPRGLAPGEYAVSPTNSNDSYCFGVDY
jgi:hypothetical protein